MKQGNTFLKAVILLIAVAFIVSPLYSQSGPRSVSIRLVQPPPNQLNISNLWKATLTNNTKAPIKIYLEGYAEEEKGGRIVEGKTEVFTLPLGKKDYKYEDFKTGSVNWINKKYEEPIIRTGTAPSGTYTICMTAKNEQGEIVGMEQCITQIVDIKTEGIITLVSPSDNEKISDANPLFIWTPPMPAPSGKLVYAIKIVEIIGNQSPEDAIKKNSPFFEKREILTTQYQYLSSNQKFQSGKKYAWGIIGGDKKSEIFTFSSQSDIHISSGIDSVNCTGVRGQYRLVMRVCVDYNNSTFQTATIENPLIFNNNCIPSPAGVTYAISYTSPAPPLIINIPSSGTTCYTFTGTITTTPPSVVTAVEIVSTIRWGSNTTEVIYLPTGVFQANNNCCVPIASLPPMVGWWTFDETSGTTFFDRAGINNQGTRVGSAGFVTGMVAGALNFTSGYVEVDDHVDMNLYSCDSLTIDAWIRTESLLTQVIVDKREATTCGRPIGYSFFTYEGKLGFQLANGVSFGNYIAPTPMINNNSWTHVAVTVSRNATSSIINLYIDGYLQHTATSFIGTFNNGAKLLIGAHYPSGSSKFNGDIDEVEIFKRVLTQPQIFSIWNAQSSGKCKN